MKIKRFLFFVLLFSLWMSRVEAIIICHTQPYIPDQECVALISFYITTNGPGWVNSSGWTINSDPCTTWYGVDCENVFGNHVTRLDLDNNGLRGYIPTAIDGLTRLRHLWLFRNHLTGSIPQEIGSLAHLERLYLGGNQLTGSIPPEIGNLPNLERLHLGENQLSDSIPPEIGNLTNLETLHLGENQLSGSIPPEIGNLTNLIVLWLNENQLCGEIPYSLVNLKDLWIHIIGLNINNNYLFTNDAVLDAFLISKGGEWESSQGSRCPADSEKTLLYQIIIGASQK